MYTKALLGLGALSLALPATPACADDAYPSRPVRIIVPFAPGGTFDLVARTVGQRLTEAWGRQIVVDNRPGGGTTIATEMAVRANPDGHTIYLSPNALAANPALRKNLRYDAARDLAPVVLVAAQPMALGIHPSSPAKTPKALLELARSRPGALSYGSAGVGSGGHLAGEIFKAAAGLDITHVSYKGGNLAMLDVVANRIPLVMTGLPNLLPMHKAGRVHIVGITSAGRSPVAPDVPTLGEAVPGYAFQNWFGLLVPAKTPQAVIARINADVNRLLQPGETRDRLVSQGFDVLGGTPQAFADTLAKDTRTFAEVLRKAGITAN